MAQVSNVKVALPTGRVELRDDEGAPSQVAVDMAQPSPGGREQLTSEPSIQGTGRPQQHQDQAAPAVPPVAAEDDDRGGRRNAAAAIVVVREDGNLDINLQPWMSAGLAGIQSVAQSLLRQRSMLQNDRGVPIDFVLKVAGLLGVRRVSMRGFHVIEALSYALPLPCRVLPGRSTKAIGSLAGGMVKAVVTSRAIGAADRLLDRLLQRWRQRQRRRRRGSRDGASAAGSAAAAAAAAATAGSAAAARNSPAELSDASTDGGLLSPSPSSAPDEPYLMKAAVVASLHKAELAQMAELLQSQGVNLPPERFNESDAELCRFAGAHGLLKGSKWAVRDGAKMVTAMLEWHRGFTFLDEEELRNWNHLVRFCGADNMGRPVLLLMLGRALVTLPRNRASWNSLSSAIVSNVDLAVQELLTDDLPGPEHLTCVLDASECQNVWQVVSGIQLLKQVVATLTNNYPGRLARLYVVDLPRVFSWMLKAVTPFMHPTTRQKLLVCSGQDARLPVDLESVRGTDASTGNVTPARAGATTVPESPENPSEAAAAAANVRQEEGNAGGAGSSGGGGGGGSAPLLPSRPRRRARGTDGAEASAPVVPQLRLPSNTAAASTRGAQSERSSMTSMFTPRGLRSNDITAMLYLIIAVAACTFLGQQAGIGSPQVMAALQKLAASMRE